MKAYTKAIKELDINDYTTNGDYSEDYEFYATEDGSDTLLHWREYKNEVLNDERMIVLGLSREALTKLKGYDLIKLSIVDDEQVSKDAHSQFMYECWHEGSARVDECWYGNEDLTYDDLRKISGCENVRKSIFTDGKNGLGYYRIEDLK
jgi:hypothetical protein